MATDNAVPTEELERLIAYYEPIANGPQSLVYPAVIVTLAAEVLAIRVEFDEVMKAWAEFRQEIRGHLFAFWPNNPGVGDGEIVDAVRRIAEQHEAGRKWETQARTALAELGHKPGDYCQVAACPGCQALQDWADAQHSDAGGA